MLVRATIPPSNRSASQRANWHYPVICYSTHQTDRWGLRDPYRVIHAWYCHNCLNKGGSVRVCKHVALLLKAISFWFWFHPTTRNICLLTTGINHQLQPPAVLQPNATGVPIPLTVNRQSRQKRSGNVNPVYATTAAVTTAPSATAAVATAAVATAAVATPSVTAAAATSAAVATPAATTAAVARPAVTTAAVTTAAAATPAVTTAATTTAAATTAAAVIVVAPTTFTYMMNTNSRPPVTTAAPPVSTSPASTTPTFTRSSIGSIPSAGSTGSGGQGGAQPAGVHGGAVLASGGQGSDAAGGQGGDAAAAGGPGGGAARDRGDGASGGQGGDAAGGQSGDAAAAGGPGGGAARDRGDGAAGGQSGDAAGGQGGDAAAAGGQGGGAARDRGGGAAGRQAQSAAGALVASPVLSQYLLTIDTSFMTPIPPPSQNPVSRHNLFQIGHLQPRGLVNAYNSCCHISLFLCCHRMCLKRYLSPARMTQRQDFSGLSFHEILSAMPSPRPFSLQLWIGVWNSLRPGQPIGQHEDIQMLSDLVLGSLDLTPDTSTTPATPVFTEFTCHYQCNSCTFLEPGTSTWEGKTFDTIPIVNPGHSASAVSVGQLLTDMLQSPIHTRCAVCRQLVVGEYRVTR